MFKVGDKVERINGEFSGMKIGDIGTVSRVIYDLVKIKEYDEYPNDPNRGCHDPENLKLYIEQKEENEI